MTTVVTTSSPSDFLALIPGLVGFDPDDSIVLVAFSGARTRGALRVDLPVESSPGDDDFLATALTGLLEKVHGADGVIPVVYTSSAFGDTAPNARLVRLLMERVARAGFSVADAFCVASDGWGSYLEPGVRRDLWEIDASSAPDRIPGGSTTEHRRADHREPVPAVGFALAERVAKSIDAFVGDGRRSAAPGVEDLLDTDIAALLEEIIGHSPQDVPDWAAAFVIALAQTPTTRDVVLFHFAFDDVTGSRVAGRHSLRGAGLELPAPSTREIATSTGAEAMTGRGPAPDAARVMSAIHLVGWLAALAPRSRRAPLLAMLAWLYWSLGRGSAAAEVVAEARRLDPVDSFAELLGSMVDAGMLPEWAFLDPGDAPPTTGVTAGIGGTGGAAGEGARVSGR